MLLTTIENTRSDEPEQYDARADGSGEPPRSTDAREPISQRELDVVRLVVAGMRNAEIGAKLQISERTVQAHVAAARRKLDARTRTHLAVRALQTGLIPLHDDQGDDDR